MEKLIQFRRKLHSYPELGFQEFETTKRIIELISSFENFDKCKITFTSKTGFWVDINKENINGENVKNVKDLSYIAFRADMDALGIIEKTNKEYSSIRKGISHSCGHDGHVTILCGFLEYILKNLKDINMKYSIRLIFQPAEEGLGGAKFMIEEKCLDNVKYIFGLHCNTLYDLGTIGYKDGCIMASTNYFTINLFNSNFDTLIVAGSEIVSKLNQINSSYRFTLAITQFLSKKEENMVLLKGNIRFYDIEALNIIQNKIKNITEGICFINEINHKLHYKGSFNPLKNDPYLYERNKSILKKNFKISEEFIPFTSSEDFSFYGLVVPSLFVLLGCKDDEHKDMIPHTGNYDFNDESIYYGIKLFKCILEEMFNDDNYQ